jgi:signal transduction histidine kinase
VRGFSLASRFLVTLVATAVLPLVLYGWFSLRGMRDQIDEQVVRVFLPQLAADHAQKIEAHLDRTWQACALVRELARIDLASPEALRAFDEQVALVPGLLDTFVDLLLLADPDGRVVYWKGGQRLDPNAHLRRAALIPSSVVGEEWFAQAQRERGAHFLPWGRSKYLHRGVEFRSMDPASHHLGLTLDVPSGNGKPAVLFALIRWSEVQLVLDQALRALLDRAGMPHAEVLLAGRDGTITAHTDRHHYGERLPDGLRELVTEATAMGHGSFAEDDGTPMRVGFAPCSGKAGGSFVVGVAVHEHDLFAASDAFERVLLVAILVSVFVLVMWSLVASRAITAPVQALVAATRRIAGGDLAVALPPRGGHELGELAGAFNTMAGELAVGREKLAAAQRDQAWAEMARQVAHEVKNPLQPMRMAAQLLQRARAEHDPRAEQVAERLARTVLEQTEALDRIAGDFRAFAGVAPAQRQEVGVAAWLEQVREQLAGLFAGKTVQFEVVVDADLAAARVAIDAKALARVFVNLVQNAHEAAPGGVRVRLSAARAGERVAVVVQDDGPGVPDAVRGRLFEPYFTTKTSGTGLGLAICRRLVEAHGGTIRLERSGPGATLFVLELPLAQGG